MSGERKLAICLVSLLSESPLQFARPPAIRFLIGPSTINICTPRPIAMGARRCVKKFYICYEMT
ncbi:hypothetical protein A2U01_0069291 [Trifolium medium]|uniref:Uncharacterized protein n=1 Tax=Trifolium medium TaxID=97028 RepID=A0A392SGM7_9FABA|nr:hypothetical protein [Trifolium medium]